MLMLKKLFFVICCFAIGLGAYFTSDRRGALDAFLASTAELVSDGTLDPNYLEVLMQPPSDPNVGEFMTTVSNQYLGHLAVEFRKVRGPEFKGIATNEPFDPNIDAVWVYIFDGHDKRFLDLPVQCNAIAYPEKDVVLIDSALINSMTRASLCSSDVPPVETWIDDPSSMVAGTASLFGSDWRDYFSQVPLDAWRMFGAVVEIDYRGRAMLPLLIIGHEIGHLALHREEPKSAWRLFSSDTDVATHMTREIEADDFAVETLILALADHDIGSLDRALEMPNEWHIQSLGTNQALQEKLRFFTLIMSGYDVNDIIPDFQLVDEEGNILRERPEGLQVVDLACEPQLIYARRLLGLAVAFGHYSWRARVSAAANGDSRFHTEEQEDLYYQNIEDMVSNKIVECGLNELY